MTNGLTERFVAFVNDHPGQIILTGFFYCIVAYLYIKNKSLRDQYFEPISECPEELKKQVILFAAAKWAMILSALSTQLTSF
jgi:hypothetical protein